MKLFTLSIFVVTYFFFIWKKEYKAQVCWIACAVLFLLGIIRFFDIFTIINWNVLGIFWGTLVLAELFSLSGVPGYLANVLVVKARYVNWAIISVCLVAGAISVFVENVATVLIIAPVALAIARKLKVSPVPFLIGIAISSNLQGAATLVGDPPSIILAGFAEMNFNDFFLLSGRPAIFFAIELGALVSVGVLYFVFRRNRERVGVVERAGVTTWIPTFLLGFMILSLVGTSFLGSSIGHRLSVNLSGIICMLFGFIGLMWHELAGLRVRKSNRGKLGSTLFHDIRILDWETFFFLAGIFLIVGSLTKAGIIDDLASFFIISLSSTTMKCHGCLWPAEGAIRAASRISIIFSLAMGVSRYRRILLLFFNTSSNFKRISNMKIEKEQYKENESEGIASNRKVIPFIFKS